MRSSMLPVMLALFVGAVCVNEAPGVQAQGKQSRGTVILKDQTTSGKQRSSGTGQVVPQGGYYIAPAVGCTVNATNVGVADGTTVYVTLEYVATANLAPVTIGSLTITGGKGYLSTLSNPTKVSTSAGLASMTVHRPDGSVLMTGSIRGL